MQESAIPPVIGSDARDCARVAFGDDLPDADIDVLAGDLDDALAPLGDEDYSLILEALSNDQIRYRHRGRLVRADAHIRALKRFLKTKDPTPDWRMKATSTLRQLSTKPRYAVPVLPPRRVHEGRDVAPRRVGPRGRASSSRRRVLRRASVSGPDDSEPPLAPRPAESGRLGVEERWAA
jgi:hypothetical protein